MTDEAADRKLKRDHRGQMPFSLIAVLLILFSSLSAVLVADIRDSSEGAGLTTEELNAMDELSEDARRRIEDLSFQVLLQVCTGDTANESAMARRFSCDLGRSMSEVFPFTRAGLIAEANASGVRMAFLRLPLSETNVEEGYTVSYIPAYASISGTIQVRVIADSGNLTREYKVTNEAMVPWPLLKDRMERFETSVTGNLGELNSLTKAMLDTLAAYRALQGWGTNTCAPGEGVEKMITEQDVVNAIDLGLVILQCEAFRNATPCMEMVTGFMDGEECWNYVKGVMGAGGIIDPADVFLNLYGYHELDWRKAISQVLYAAVDRIALRWMEWLDIIAVVNIAESTGEALFFTANDLIDHLLGVDLAEDQFKDWLEGKFDHAGVPDTLYRYLGEGGPEDSINVPAHYMELVDESGSPIYFSPSGHLTMDIPEIDVLDWEGWGDFHEQYRRGTEEILSSMRQSVAVMADSISRSMFVPTDSLVLDPRDGLSFPDEVSSALDHSLACKGEWMRPALAAAEQFTSTVDPLAEATKSVFLENKDAILGRSSTLDILTSSAAEQLLVGVMEANPELELPWEENIIIIEQAIISDEGWTLGEEIVNAYERQASFLTDNFLSGLNYRLSLSGHQNSYLVDLIARTGDPLIGLGAVLSDDIELMLLEMSQGLNLRGSRTEVSLPLEDHFRLTDAAGRTYRETLRVQIEYPSLDSSGGDLNVVLTDPRRYVGEPEHYPQLHDTNMVKMKWASFQSVWGLLCSGELSAHVSPGGEISSILPLELEKEIDISSSQTITVLTGHALVGVCYCNINTLGHQIADAVELVLRPMLDGLSVISSGLQGIYRALQDTVRRLLDLGTRILDSLSEMLQKLVEGIQQFIREAVLELKAEIVEATAKVLGEKVFRFNFLGVSMTVHTNPIESAFREMCVPASFSLSFGAAGCTIDVTTRLIKDHGDFSLLTNATLDGQDWSVHAVIDPFMDMFRHMVEVRGVMDGSIIELVLPELVSYRTVSFALSDIPGVGAMLSNIPIPVPGLKGSLDAGMYVKVLEGRTDTVVINEYELNPAGEDEGREWVELYNPTSEAIDLVGWTLQTSHGVQAMGSLAGVLMPGERLVHQFDGQALDNLGSGFPVEESIVLRDAQGRRVDDTPFATDYWNDGRTWQRAQDGTDRWEFREGTRGRSNGKDPMILLDMTSLQQAFVSAATESMYELSSGEQNMDSLARTLASATAHLAKRLTAIMLSKEVEMGLFVEVAASEYSSAARVGMRMELSMRCGTVGDMLDHLSMSVRSLTAAFGNPFQVRSSESSLENDIWVGISAFGAIGIPKMISTPGVSLEVKYVASIDVNLAVLSSVLGARDAGWAMEAGAAVCGVPAGAINMLNAPSDTLVDIWLCKASIHEMST